MYAVIRTGGKQYRVAANDVVSVDSLAGEVGASVELTDVLAIDAGAGLKIGAPTVAGAKVTASIVGHKRNGTVLVFKKRRRKNSRRKNGHRQEMTQLRIDSIVA